MVAKEPPELPLELELAVLDAEPELPPELEEALVEEPPLVLVAPEEELELVEPDEAIPLEPLLVVPLELDELAVVPASSSPLGGNSVQAAIATNVTLMQYIPRRFI